MARVYKYYSEFNENRVPVMIADKSTAYRVDNRRQFNTQTDMYELGIALNLDKATEEHAYCACFNAKLRIIGFFEISHGNATATLVDKRIVFQKALLLGAIKIALIHNHPSGDITPSDEDIALTRGIAQGGRLIGITLVDHIILGDRNYFSFYESMRDCLEEKEA